MVVTPMNRQLRHVAVAALLMFAALLINSNIVQVGEASSLRANPHNVRVLYGEYSHQRGPIVVGGQRRRAVGQDPRRAEVPAHVSGRRRCTRR